MDACLLSLVTGERFYLLCPLDPTSVQLRADSWGFSGWSFLNTEHDLIMVEDLETDPR